MVEDVEGNIKGFLSSAQIKELRKRTATQIIIFLFVFLTLTSVSAGGLYLFLRPSAGEIPLLVIILMSAISGFWTSEGCAPVG